MLEGHTQVTFSDRGTLSSFERILSAKYDESLKAGEVTFDLSRLEWVGFVAASLFFSWGAELLTKKEQPLVKIKLPHKGLIAPQVKKVLLDYQFAGTLKDLGADVDYLISDYPHDGVPVRILKSKDTLRTTVQEMKKEFGRMVGAKEISPDILNAAFEIGIYELAENCFFHANGKVPHIAISSAKSSGPISNFEGLVTVFERDTPYIEILLGDLGPGIVKKLSPVLPDDYCPPFERGGKYLKSEAVISYAFEFASTSDPEMRKKRISQLLGGDQIDLNRIGTGLFCVLEVTRHKRGQLIIRAPEGLLALDFSKNPSVPIAKGKINLGLSHFAKLKGTHYLLRIPLIISAEKKTYHQVAISLPDIDYQVINPFKGSTATSDLPIVIHEALELVNTALLKTRHSEGITLLMPPSFPLISRAIAVFLASLQAMQPGKRLIIWYNTTATSVLPKEQYISASSGSLSCSAIFIGSELSNYFIPYGCVDTLGQNWKDRITFEDNKVIFDENTFRRINNIYIEAIKEEIIAILQGPEVLHSQGPFLIEGQYYTTKYYQISKAFEAEFNMGMFAQWCAGYIPNGTEIIVCTEPFLKPIAELAVEFLLKKGIDIQLIDFISQSESIPKFTMMLLARGKKAVVLTDVICRGERTKDFLSFLPLIDIVAILTIVDSRNKRDIGKPLPYQAKSGSTLLGKVISILQDSIAIYKDPPIQDRYHLDKNESIFVIDRVTKAPTLYVRPSEPYVKFSEIPKEPIIQSEALLAGHYEYAQKHYSYFLHIPRLLRLWRNNVENWVTEQTQFVENFKTPEHDRGQPWNACIYSPQNSLDWLEDSLANLPVKFSTIKILSREQLLAPEPPTTTSAMGNLLMVLPAIASGETARLFIEYGSRKSPGNILFLCFLSRMDPYHQTFLTGIKRYWDAQLHVAFYLEFPIKAYQFMSEPCPMCSEMRHIEKWLALARRKELPKGSPLIEALSSKASASKPFPLEYIDGDLSTATPPSKHSIDRAHMRSLYELSEYDLNARRQLNALLANSEWIDRFLEVLSVERLSQIFSLEALNLRLYKSFPSVKNRTQDILDEMEPPFPIGRYVGAMVHLVPHAFMGTAVDLIHRFADSKRDIEEICIGLLLVNIIPALTRDIYAKARDIGDHSVGTLFSETLDLLKYATERDMNDYDQSARAFSALLTRFTRSDEFSDNVKALKLTLEKGDYEWSDVVITSNHILNGWKKISELIITLYSTPVWPRLMERHPEIGQFVAALDRYIAHLDQLIKTPVNEGVISQLCSIAGEIDRSVLVLLERVDGLFINPVICDARKLPDEIIASDGSKLRLIREVDYNVPLTFCDLDDLNQVVNEITANWQKHKVANKGGSNVIYKIFIENDYVCMEFGDDIEGDFDLSSEGGLKIVQDFCSAYGCSIDIKKDPSTMLKSTRHIITYAKKLKEVRDYREIEMTSKMFKILLVDDSVPVEKQVSNALAKIGVNVEIDFRNPDGIFTEKSLSALLPQEEDLNNYDLALIDLELFDIKMGDEYNAEDLAGGTKVLPFLRLHAPWLTVIGLSKLFRSEAQYFFAVAGSFGFDGHFPRHIFLANSFNKNFWDGVIERAELLRKKAVLGVDFNGPNKGLHISTSKKTDSQLNANFPNWQELVQTLFHFSEKVTLEPVGEGYSGASTLRAIAFQRSILEASDSEWLVKISTNPFKLHLESQAHFKMLRSGLEYARMVPLLWNDVVVVDRVGAIVYQFAEGTTVAIDIAKNPDGAKTLCTRLVPTFDKMYKKAKRIVDREVIGNLISQWFSLDKLKPIVDGYKHIALCDELSELSSAHGEEKNILSSVVSYNKCFVHGDLHLRNILIGDRDILIDFAKAGSGPIVVDMAKLCSDMILNISEMRQGKFPYWDDDTCIVNQCTSPIRPIVAFDKGDIKLYNIILLCYFMTALTYDSTSLDIKEWIKTMIDKFSL